MRTLDSSSASISTIKQQLGMIKRSQFGQADSDYSDFGVVDRLHVVCEALYLVAVPGAAEEFALAGELVDNAGGGAGSQDRIDVGLRGRREKTRLEAVRGLQCLGKEQPIDELLRLRGCRGGGESLLQP